MHTFCSVFCRSSVVEKRDITLKWVSTATSDKTLLTLIRFCQLQLILLRKNEAWLLRSITSNWLVQTENARLHFCKALLSSPWWISLKQKGFFSSFKKANKKLNCHDRRNTTKRTQAYRDSSQGEEKKKIPLLFEVVVCICTGRLQMTSVLFKCSRNATPQPLIISLAP